MFVTVLVILCLIWAAWIVQALLSAWQWRQFAGKFGHTQHSGNAKGRPLAAIIVPFKGLDIDLPSAIQSLCTLNYPAYELLLVVDSKQDPVHNVLAAEIAKYPQIKSQILIAGHAGMYEGQKVHNQLYAIDHLLKQREAVGVEQAPKVWVFADSDAIPGSDWLIDLIRPLYSPTVGMSTGYRWIEPALMQDKGSDETYPNFWASVASVINSSGIGFLGKAKYNHAWGGSMALWVDTAIQGDLKGHLQGALCDDYQFSKMVRSLGLRIYFVRSCLVATPASFDWAGLVNFAHRQYLLTRVYAPKLYYGTLLMVGFYVLANLSAIAGFFWLLFRDPLAWYYWAIPLFAMLMVGFWNQMRASQRKASAALALGPAVASRLALPFSLDRWLTWFWMGVNLVLILRAFTGRGMLWRGIFYRLKGPQDVERMNRS